MKTKTKKKAQKIYLVVDDSGHIAQKYVFSTQKTAESSRNFVEMFKEKGDEREFFIRELTLVECGPDDLIETLRGL